MDLAQVQALAERAGSLSDEAQIREESTLNVLHTDGDYAAYYFAGNDDVPLGTAKRNMVNFFQAAATIVGVPTFNIQVHLTDPMSDKGKRYKIGTIKLYQGQRTHSQRPKNWQGLRDFLHAGMPGSNMKVVNWTDREADDGAAFAAARDIEEGRHPTILFRDKDWRIFPGNHMRWTDYEQINVPPGTYEIVDDEEQVYGHKFFWLQMLQGDTADNIPGLEKIQAVDAKGKLIFKNCGEVCAAQALAGTSNNVEAYNIVSQAYSDFYGPGWQVRFAEQAMLLWMRTDQNASIHDFLQVVPVSEQHTMMEAIRYIEKRIRA